MPPTTRKATEEPKNDVSDGDWKTTADQMLAVVLKSKEEWAWVKHTISDEFGLYASDMEALSNVKRECVLVQ